MNQFSKYRVNGHKVCVFLCRSIFTKAPLEKRWGIRHGQGKLHNLTGIKALILNLLGNRKRSCPKEHKWWQFHELQTVWHKFEQDGGHITSQMWTVVDLWPHVPQAFTKAYRSPYRNNYYYENYKTYVLHLPYMKYLYMFGDFSLPQTGQQCHRFCSFKKAMNFQK